MKSFKKKVLRIFIFIGLLSKNAQPTMDAFFYTQALIERFNHAGDEDQSIKKAAWAQCDKCWRTLSSWACSVRIVGFTIKHKYPKKHTFKSIIKLEEKFIRLAETGTVEEVTKFIVRTAHDLDLDCDNCGSITWREPTMQEKKEASEKHQFLQKIDVEEIVINLAQDRKQESFCGLLKAKMDLANAAGNFKYEIGPAIFCKKCKEKRLLIRSECIQRVCARMQGDSFFNIENNKKFTKIADAFMHAALQGTVDDVAVVMLDAANSLKLECFCCDGASWELVTKLIKD